MKEKIERLYLAKCRKCIPDIIMNYYEDKKIINPRPDYIDYYTILKMNDDNTFIDLYDFKKSVRLIKLNDDVEKTYDSDLILDYEPLSNYIDLEKISKKDSELSLNIICKTKKLSNHYGYINN